MEDQRERPLNDAARSIMVQSNYDPHYSTIEERVIMETKLFLTRWDALMSVWRAAGMALKPDDPIPIIPNPGRSVPRVPDPIPMILFCPFCGTQHIDAEEDHKDGCALNVNPHACNCDRWSNPPHRSHQCRSCSHVWRPADVPTTGVSEIATHGEHDSPNQIRELAFDPPRW